MNKVQYDDEQFIVMGPDSLKPLILKQIEVLKDRMDFYKYLFNITDFRKVEIYLFDNNDDFREYVYSLRGERESLPEYAKAVFDNGMIIRFASNNPLYGTPLYYQTVHSPSHELFHIIYFELVLNRDEAKRIIWFDEGMAQYFSNQNSHNDFDKWFDRVVESTKIIPDINSLKYALFQTKEYSGYDLSYLSVKYLIDTLGIDEFKKLMGDVDRILEYGKTVVSNAIDYYKRKQLKNTFVKL